MKLNKNDEYFMAEAIKEAMKAYNKKEVPVGCVIVYEDKIIARAHNLREKMNSATAHAEILAINKACKKIGSWRLENTKIYVTLEPCPMCAGAIINARISELIYGAKEPKSGVASSITNLFEEKFNHKVLVKSGILQEEISLMLKRFFKELRELK